MKAESARAGKSPEGRFAAAFGEPGLYALVAGCFLRLFYVIFSTIYDRQYDIGMIDLDAGHTVTGGHLAYIQYLFENGHLPDFDPTSVYQFNHPPLHHAVSALWLKFASLFLKDTAVLEESLQVVPFLCSLLILAVLALRSIIKTRSSGGCSGCSGSCGGCCGCSAHTAHKTENTKS